MRAIGLLLLGCGEQVEPGKIRRESPSITDVEVMALSLETIPSMYEAVGTVRAKNVSILASKITGTVTDIKVREGSKVKKGETLLTIDDREITAKLASAQGNLEAAKAQEVLARDTYYRHLNLFDKKVITKQEFQTVETRYRVAEQEVNRMHAEIRRLKALLTYTRLWAPTDGLITKRHVDIGSLITSGIPLVTMEDVKSGYRLEVWVEENMTKRVRLGEEVKIFVDALGNESFSGRVSEITPATDPLSRSFMVKIDVDAPDLRSGMFGKAMFPMEPRQVLLVPKKVILERGQLSGVYVVNKEGLVSFRLIKTSRALKDSIEVISGLSPGEEIIVSGLDKVMEGAKIQR
jgi:RND family efflux transporter MFP subunit